MVTTNEQVLEDLAEFRSAFAADLNAMTGSGESRSDRAGAQEGLQLVWSFVVSGLGADTEISPRGIELLRGAFPDELFGNDPESRFAELRENVPNAYADQWKYMPSDHLCSLVQGCVTNGDPEPVARYREHGLILATATCVAMGEITARKVFDLAKFDAMLKHIRVLTEVGISEATVPIPDQIKAFYMNAGPDHSLSFGFLGGTEPELARAMIDTFAAQHGTATVDALVEMAITETVDANRSAALAALRSGD
ncbi:MAG: hypothetical protein KDB26_09305 [Microthrixaceae bacterium]|nr:hypothetical protein [Microthrixaceae bacterium]